MKESLVVSPTVAMGSSPHAFLEYYGIPRRAKIGILIRPSTNQKTTAAASSEATTKPGRGAMAIPLTASVDM
jgi:hypothetical protein